MRKTPWGAVRRTPGMTRSMRSEAAIPVPSRRLLAISVAIALILSLMAVFAMPALGGPKGGDQQGTVKIHEGAGEPSPVMRNEPKVCTFHIHGFNFHEGEDIVWWIEEKGDQGWGSTVLSGTAEADQDGEWRDPEAGAHTLDDGHYKLYVDRAPEFDPPIKHKVFKVECEEEVAPASTTTTTAEVGGIVVTTTLVEDTTTTAIEDQVLGTVITAPTTAPGASVSGDEVLGASVEAEVLSANVEAEELPFTGAGSEELIGLAVLLLTGGLLVLGLTGRREES